MADYVITKELTLDFDEAVPRVKEALAAEGFGVLSEIPIHEKLKEKLGVDFKRYVILGACHPPSAYQALLAEESIGVLLPCNVVVHEVEGGVAVKAVRPTRSLSVTGRTDLAPLGEEVEDRLRRALAAL